MPEFLLQKWYLDYITPDYNTSIFYKGSLRYGPFEVHHCSELKKDHGFITNEIFWDNKKSSITCSENIVTFKLNDKTFSWNSLCNPLVMIIYEKGNKFIKWHCVQPLAKVEMSGFEREQSIFGYVEHLETNILPWAFEFDNLIWGRFTNAQTSVVWMNLEGPFSRKLVLMNGKEINADKISMAEIIFEGGNIKIQDLTILREGNLMSTLLANMPFLKQIVPKTGLPIYEQKILAKGFLTLGDQFQEGQIIHEVVRWK
jgi:hypothetical protein